MPVWWFSEVCLHAEVFDQRVTYWEALLYIRLKLKLLRETELGHLVLMFLPVQLLLLFESLWYIDIGQHFHFTGQTSTAGRLMKMGGSPH